MEFLNKFKYLLIVFIFVSQRFIVPNVTASSARSIGPDRCARAVPGSRHRFTSSNLKLTFVNENVCL